mgnify:CR=1 FL=1
MARIKSTPRPAVGLCDQPPPGLCPRAPHLRYDPVSGESFLVFGPDNLTALARQNREEARQYREEARQIQEEFRQRREEFCQAQEEFRRRAQEELRQRDLPRKNIRNGLIVLSQRDSDAILYLSVPRSGKSFQPPYSGPPDC